MRTMNGLVKKLMAVALLAGLAACQAADGTSQAPDTALISSMMRGLGAVDPKEKPIDYQPRAPLAMPANAGQLPAPETELAGTDSANWPKQKENPQLEELRALYANQNTDSDSDERLTPAQMRGFKITGVTGQAPRDIKKEERAEELAEGATLTRAEQKGFRDKQQKIKAEKASVNTNGLGARRYLTEPPVEYSTPSPDAPLPIDVSKNGSDKPKVKDWEDDQRLDPRCLKGESQYCD